MRGIASRFVIPSLLPGESELGEPSKATLFSFATVWVFASRDCGRLHTSDTPVSSAIRTSPTTSTLTRMYCDHPRPSTLVVTREIDRMFLFYGDQLSHRLVKNLATWTTRERGINRRTRNHDWDVGGTLQRSLLGHTWLRICFKVRLVIQRFNGILELRLGLIDLKDDVRNFFH